MPQLNSRSVLIALALMLGVGGLLGAQRSARHAVARDRTSLPGPHQTTGCPEPSQPGQLVWAFPADRSVFAAPAIDTDGSLYIGTIGGKLYSVDCRGKKRWEFDAPSVGIVGRGTSRGSFTGSPVLHTDGRIYVGLENASASAVYSVGSAGSPQSSIAYPLGIAGALVVDPLDRVFVGSHSATGSAATVVRSNPGSIAAFSTDLAVLPGYPITTNAIAVAPVLLAGNRVVFTSQNNPRAETGAITGTVTATAVFPVRRTTTPTAPTATAPPPTRTASPTPTPTTPASTTPTQSATPRLPRWSVFLPWGSGGSQTLAVAWQPPVQAQRSPRVLATQAQGGVSLLSQLHIITDAGPPGKAFALSDRAATSMIATGDVVILTMSEEPPRIVALAVNSDPPVVLWEHFTIDTIAGSPVLGPLDPATGRVELVYSDNGGILASLSVPATPWATGQPTFNWAVRLDQPTFGTPALGDDGLVYIPTDQAVLAFKRVDGSEVWKLTKDDDSRVDSISGSVMLAPGGMLYVATQQGILAISTGSQGLDPDARWPALHRDHRNSGQAMP